MKHINETALKNPQDILKAVHSMQEEKIPNYETNRS
jgi:hypothetical protein